MDKLRPWVPFAGFFVFCAVAAIFYGVRLPVAPEESGLDFWTGVLAVGTVLLAAGTFIVAWFGYRADRANQDNARRQIRAEEELRKTTAMGNRAYLAVRVTSVYVTPQDPSTAVATLSVHNYGRVPARDVRSTGSCIVTQAGADAPERPDRGYVMEIGAIAPGAEVIVWCPPVEGVRFPDNGQMRKQAFVIGKIDYLDGFSEDFRVTEFYISYSLTPGHSGHTPQEVLDKEVRVTGRNNAT